MFQWLSTWRTSHTMEEWRYSSQLVHPGLEGCVSWVLEGNRSAMCDFKIFNKGSKEGRRQMADKDKKVAQKSKASPSPRLRVRGLCCPASLLCFLPFPFLALHSLFRSLPDSVVFNYRFSSCLLEIIWTVSDMTPAHEGNFTEEMLPGSDSLKFNSLFCFMSS